MQHEHILSSCRLIIAIIANVRQAAPQRICQLLGCEDQPAVYRLLNIDDLVALLPVHEPVGNFAQLWRLTRNLRQHLNSLRLHDLLYVALQGGKVRIGICLLPQIVPELITEYQVQQQKSVDEHIFGPAPIHISRPPLISGFYFSF
ncbi:hypothetical protein D3C77_597060 [compost metagenome]